MNFKTNRGFSETIALHKCEKIGGICIFVTIKALPPEPTILCVAIETGVGHFLSIPDFEDHDKFT